MRQTTLKEILLSFLILGVISIAYRTYRAFSDEGIIFFTTISFISIISVNIWLQWINFCERSPQTKRHHYSSR